MAGAGEEFYVAYDLFGSSGTDTTMFTLEVSCTPVVCGDDVISGDEECDDGDMEDGDGCASDCTVESGFICMGEPSVCMVSCGNSVVDDSEGCDDGNTEPGDGCAADCSVEADYVCSGEPSVCEIACGNGSLDEGEECDDGGIEAGDGCNRDCMVETGFECRAEPSDCRANMCGDTTVGWGESCDDMNDVTGDGCHLCALEIDASADAIPPGDLDLIISLSGSLDDTDPTWNRPGFTCGANPDSGYFYDEHRIVNTSGAEQTLTITATWDAGDGYLHVFGPTFDPTMPTAMCIAGDDDFMGRGGSQLVDVTIADGATLSVIASAFDPDDAIGDYTIEVEVDGGL